MKFKYLHHANSNTAAHNIDNFIRETEYKYTGF